MHLGHVGLDIYSILGGFAEFSIWQRLTAHLCMRFRFLHMGTDATGLCHVPDARNERICAREPLERAQTCHGSLPGRNTWQRSAHVLAFEKLWYRKVVGEGNKWRVNTSTAECVFCMLKFGLWTKRSLSGGDTGRGGRPHSLWLIY